MISTHEILENAKNAVADVSNLSSAKKNEALLKIAEALLKNETTILSANARDVEASRGAISDSMIDRLTLNHDRIEGMRDGIVEVSKLDDPCGIVLDTIKPKSGLLIEKVTVPLGVVAIIYESRPNVTSDALALALKSGNVCILRGGKEAFETSKAIVDVAKGVLKDLGINQSAINLIEDTTRASATELMEARGYVDLLVPRGGAGLINAVVENAKVPCIETGTGICHVYVDESADQEMALNIVENAKTSRPSVCNAMEVLLVNKNIAEKFLPLIKQRLCGENAPHKVELRCDDTSAKILGENVCSEQDFDTEFLDYIMAIAVVNDVKAAVKHIAKHSTHHSDAIVTSDDAAADYFVKNVDSAAVYVNASTRFTDGGEFGMGCEMGIATQKMHARGPFGLRELTTWKYIIHGCGQIRV